MRILSHTVSAAQDGCTVKELLRGLWHISGSLLSRLKFRDAITVNGVPATIRTSASRMLLVGTAQIAAKTTRDSQGVAVVTLKKNQTIASVVPADTLELANPHRYRVRSLPATGALIRAEDEGEQMTLL